MSKKIQKNEPKRWQIIAASCIIGAAGLLIILSVVLPIVKINADFDKIIDKMSDISTPEISISDMNAENIFGGTKGEVNLVSADLVRQLANAADNMSYDGKTTDALGAWDIRFRVKGEGELLEIYLAKDRMYYVDNGGVQYNFTPENDDAKKAYDSLYNTVKDLVK